MESPNWIDFSELYDVTPQVFLTWNDLIFKLFLFNFNYNYPRSLESVFGSPSSGSESRFIISSEIRFIKLVNMWLWYFYKYLVRTDKSFYFQYQRFEEIYSSFIFTLLLQQANVTDLDIATATKLNNAYWRLHLDIINSFINKKLGHAGKSFKQISLEVEEQKRLGTYVYHKPGEYELWLAYLNTTEGLNHYLKEFTRVSLPLKELEENRDTLCKLFVLVFELYWSNFKGGLVNGFRHDLFFVFSTYFSLKILYTTTYR